MTIEELLEIEPYFNNIVHYVKEKNKLAKTNNTYWHQVWKQAKIMSFSFIGIGTDDERINKGEHWDLFHNHLKSLATNCK